MTTVALFSSLRSRRCPSSEAFLVPLDLPTSALLSAIETMASEITSPENKNEFRFQRLNCKLLIGKIQMFSVLINFLRVCSSCSKNPPPLPSSALLCFKELYLILCRSKMLLDYCCKCRSRVWLLLQNPSISSHFHDLNQEISTLLDVLPSHDLNLTKDVEEQLLLLKTHSLASKFFFLDEKDDCLRLKMYEFLDHLGRDRALNTSDLHFYIFEQLGLVTAESCRVEMEFLEEQVVDQEGDIEPPASTIAGVISLIRYSRFLLFDFEQDEEELSIQVRRIERRNRALRMAEPQITIPKDFCCPISLDLIRDPVMICTGQTYERGSICRWIEEGHSTCPKTGQLLVHTNLIQNRALKNLIHHWCSSNYFPLDSDSCDSFSPPSKSALRANRDTTLLLIRNLSSHQHIASQAIAARELRLLAKTGAQNRAFIAEAGAIPLLKNLLTSPNSVAQENSVTALLNLSIHHQNKHRIMEEEGCLKSISYVLRYGHTMEARGNAAAALFSLSSVHCYKKTIAAGEEGVVEGLVELLRQGSGRGKKDAATALFNLSTHGENCRAMVNAGVVHALVGALVLDVVSEEVAGVLAMVVRRPEGLDAVVKEEEEAVSGLIGAMRCGSPRGKEHAVAALLELCRGGGVATTERVVKAPALSGLLQRLLFTGTKRARRKAASLARVFQRRESGYGVAGGGTGEASVVMPISVQVS